MSGGVIVCGVDDSESAKQAARLARSLAGRLGLGLLFVHVVEPDTPESELRSTAERLGRLSADTTSLDSGATWCVDVGAPVERLLARAEEVGAPMVVVPSNAAPVQRQAAVVEGGILRFDLQDLTAESSRA